MTRHWSLPSFSLRCLHVWRRNLLVWKKLALASMIGNLADPMLYMLGFGYGLGRMMPDAFGGTTYIAFLAAGTVCSSTMMSASFEAMYSGFSRMHVQKTWEALLNTPLALDDIVLAEMLWAATKSLISGMAILAVLFGLGIGLHPTTFLVPPLLFIIGMTFASIALIVNALAKAYDFFTYYFTLVLTPMIFLSGVYYPTTQLPAWLQTLAALLPLSAAVDLVRPLLLGQMPESPALKLAALLAYGATGFYLALVLTRRRLLK